MKTFKDTLNVAWKDLQVIMRDRGFLAIVLLLPLVFGMMMSTIYQSQVDIDEQGDQIQAALFKLSVVNQDLGHYGEQVVSGLESIGILDLQLEQGEDAAERVDQAVGNGDLFAAVIIPSDFSQKIDDYLGAEIVLKLDPNQNRFESVLRGLLNYGIAPAALQGEIRYGIRQMIEESGAFGDAPPELRAATEAQTFGVVMTQLAEMVENPTIAVEEQSPEEDTEAQPFNFFNMFIPGFTVMFAFFLVGAIGDSLFKEKVEGTFRRLLSGPLERGSIIGGKMLAYGAFVVFQVFFLFGISSLIGNLTLGDSPLGLLLVTLALALSVSTFGLMVAALSKSGKQADSIGTALGFLLAGLGGCFQFGLVPLYMQDNTLGKLSQLTPQAHALEGYYTLITLNGDVVDILPQVVWLLGFSLVFFLVARWRLAKFYTN